MCVISNKLYTYVKEILIMNTNYTDPLDELINKHKAANGEPVESVEIPLEKDTAPTAESLDAEPIKNTADFTVGGINFGDNDLEAEIAAEDAAREKARRDKYEAMKAAREEQNHRVAMPPQPHDAVKEKQDIDFQADKLGIVTGMVNRVVAKYKLFTGGIPGDIRMKVMGELVDQYHNKGELIDEEFENMIISNWYMEDGTPAADYIRNGMKLETTEEKKAEEAKPEEEPEPTAQININVPTNTPVTVNIDSETVQEMTNTRVIDINVYEVSEKDLVTSSKVVENSQLDGIITPYDSGINDVPITLPASAYRCTMKPIAWLDFIKLVAPTAGTRADNELRKWSVLYSHLKNPSIGNFKSFDDFLKHTKYQDRELLMWGLLVATADEEENLGITCGNEKCKARNVVKYKPREIIHLDPEYLPKKYNEVHEAAAGEEAIALHNEISNTIKRYKLPDTGIIVDIKEPSAHDFINKKLPLLSDLFKRFHPDSNMEEMNLEDATLAEFEFLSANALYIEAMTIVKDGTQYRYTNWDDIENILRDSLSTDDSAVLLKIIQQSKSQTSPVSFRIHDIECPRCHYREKYLNISDIGSTLLFQVSRRLDNTQINLKEMEQK